MEYYLVEGGCPLTGEVEIAGAKNAALAIIAASIMTNETVTIENVPDVSDIRSILKVIEIIGGYVDRVDRHTYRINGSGIARDVQVNNDLVRKIRGSYYLIGSLLGKHRSAAVAMPGGCNIGPRPIDQHIKGFKALGASVRLAYPGLIAKATHLRGAHIYQDVVSVGSTINIMMAAVLADGTTIIENAAKEPHVVDVANFMNSMGARIKGAGTDVIKVRGVDRLHGTTYSIIPDQIEAGTFMFAAAATRGDIVVKNVIPKHLESLSVKLQEIGCDVIESDDKVRVSASGRLGRTNIKTLPYPGFPTDMQPQVTVVLGLSQGTSIVTENVFESRFKYVDELAKMGACITVEGNSAIIDGVEGYVGAHMSSPDLRAGAALVIAALAADGRSEIYDIHYIERGYEDFPEKLQSLGAKITKVDTEKDGFGKQIVRVI